MAKLSKLQSLSETWVHQITIKLEWLYFFLVSQALPFQLFYSDPTFLLQYTAVEVIHLCVWKRDGWQTLMKTTSPVRLLDQYRNWEPLLPLAIGGIIFHSPKSRAGSFLGWTVVAHFSILIEMTNLTINPIHIYHWSSRTDRKRPTPEKKSPHKREEVLNPGSKPGTGTLLTTWVRIYHVSPFPHSILFIYSLNS